MLGYNVHQMEIAAKLSIPIRAMSLRVARANIEVSLSTSPNTAFLELNVCIGHRHIPNEFSFCLCLFCIIYALNYSPTILSIEPIPVAPKVERSIVTKPNIHYLSFSILYIEITVNVATKMNTL